jgi:hypothetical protein
MALSVAELQATLHDLFNDTARQLAKDTPFCRRECLLTGPVFAGSLLRALASEQQVGRQIDGTSRELDRCKIQNRSKQPSPFDRRAALDAEFRRLDQAA